MGTALKPPGPARAPLIEWRASRIQDPVERLRFLRHAAEPGLRLEIGERFRKAGGWRLVVSVLLWLSLFIPAHTPSRARGTIGPSGMSGTTLAAGNFAVPQVWTVENTPDFDLYSNGLRIENEFAIAGRPRTAYPVFRADATAADFESEKPQGWHSDPAGIVFHSTESHQAPFEISELRSLKRIGRNLLDYVRSQQSYHFVIDRFGRVFRVVGENGIANHAGRSIWSDSKGTYVGLNASFLSIAFESQTDATVPLSSAQLHAAKVLTGMLRGKFGIPASNCVTHSQVSVNPSNWRIGYHTDWASGFPFSELGLPDNYTQMVPSMLQFGFEYDEAFLAATGRPWTGLLASAQLIRERARADGESPASYRQRLQERYRKISAQLRLNEEVQDEK
jgi:N-acetylmuramoyl-L-alanine amidase